MSRTTEAAARPELTGAVEVAAPPGAWPPASCCEHPLTVTFEAGLSEGPRPVLAIARVLRLRDRVLAGSVIWATTFSSVDEAGARLEWLRAHPDECESIGRRVSVIGDLGVAASIEVGLVVARMRSEREEALRAEHEEKERIRAAAHQELRSRIDCYVFDKKGQFAIDLRRGNEKKGFYVILFRERWERERFRDWFRWQRSRYAEWAEFLQTHEAIELDRLLLAEMLETERRIRKTGLSAGGRRPLRFWRGDAQ